MKKTTFLLRDLTNVYKYQHLYQLPFTMIPVQTMHFGVFTPFLTVTKPQIREWYFPIL